MIYVCAACGAYFHTLEGWFDHLDIEAERDEEGEQ